MSPEDLEKDGTTPAAVPTVKRGALPTPKGELAEAKPYVPVVEDIDDQADPDRPAP